MPTLSDPAAQAAADHGANQRCAHCAARDEAALAAAPARLDPAARAFLAQAHQRAQAQRFAP